MNMHTNAQPQHTFAQMCMSTYVHSHTYTQKQPSSLKDECKRFIFRPLGPLLCSDSTERMKELASICVGGGAFIVAPSSALVPECRSERNESDQVGNILQWQ